ncbi:MAG: hypothetical protein IT367_04840 [Candidatus Hydrogenedentes bacterium]|nr:hypothetical protein [Candidatus Hydrogenedentota bacterium]
MHYLYILRPVRPELVAFQPSDEDEAILEEHLRYLEELEHRGVLLMAGHTTAEGVRTFEMCAFQAESEGAARDIMNKDPAVWRGIMTADLFPFKVTAMATPHAQV